MNPAAPPRFSLNTRITLATLIIFISSLWALLFFAGRMLHQGIERTSGEQQFSTASLLAAQIDRGMEVRLKALENSAPLAALAMQLGPEAMQDFLEQRLDLHGLFNGGVSVLDLQGHVIAEFPPSQGGNGSKRNGIDTLLFDSQEERARIGRPELSSLQKKPAVHIDAPVRDAQGNPVGVMSGAITLGLPDSVDQIAGNHYGKTGEILLIAPKYRMIVTASDPNRELESLPEPGISPEFDRFLAGDEGYIVTASPGGTEMLVSAKSLPATGWYVLLTLPTEEALGPFTDIVRLTFFAAILLTLLVAVMTWRTLKWQLSPLLRTARTLAEMQEHNRPLHPLPVIRDDEFGRVVKGFNQLLNTLAEREIALKKSQRYQTAVFDNFPFHVWLKDDQGRFLSVNKNLADALDCPSAESMVGKTDRDFSTPELAESYIADDREVMASGKPKVVQELTRDHGRLIWVETFKYPIYIDGTLIGTVGFSRDITERKLGEEKLKLAASVFTHAREGILITDAQGAIIDVNDTLLSITGYSREEVIGENPRIFNSGLQDKAFYEHMWASLLEQGHWSGEIWNRRKTGESYPAMLTISAVRNEDGGIIHYVALTSDISAAKEYERQLEHLAHFDILTKLPNRTLLGERLNQAMAQTKRQGRLLAVAYLDLDRFKEVNDKHGHETGDQLLIALANRMKSTLRESDTFARIGGDEFVAILFDLDNIASCVPMLARLLDAAAQTVIIGDLELQVSACLGVTYYPQNDEVDADQLLRQSDQAMYQAKLAGKNRYHIFDAEMDRSVRGRHESLEQIRQALANHEFVLHYQPKVNMRTGAIIGAEALIRWQHPLRGLLSPAVFLPVIEDHLLELELGDWVIDTALTQIELWRDEGLDIPVSVNVSAYQLQHANFVGRVQGLLAAHPAIRPGDLEMEVLETSGLQDFQRVAQVIEACRELGVLFALDDFGTGYSSLTYLKRLAVAKLKIDQSFVRNMLDDPDDFAILGGILSLATAFRRHVIAEGVETVEHGELLLQLGCELAQGYGIARPMPADDLPAWARSWRPNAAWSHVPSVKRNDLPLLFACVEHRAWVMALEDFLIGGRKTLPQVHHQCGLDEWLETEGAARHGDKPAFRELVPLHRQMHELAQEMCQLKARNIFAQAHELLPQLHALRDALLKNLKELVSKNRE